MNVLVVEDEKLNFDWLNSLLMDHFNQINEVFYASDINTALTLYLQKQPELIFLDIRLGKENGFELLDLLPQPHPHIIFTTAHEQYAIDAIRKGAHDYLLKPVRKKELSSAFDRLAKKGVETRAETLVIKSQKESHFVDYETIIYVKAERAYSNIITSEKNLLVSQSLTKFGERLDGFFKCHRSYIINPSHIRKYIGNDGHVIMSNGDRVPISDSYLKDFKKEFGL